LNLLRRTYRPEQVLKIKKKPLIFKNNLMVCRKKLDKAFKLDLVKNKPVILKRKGDLNLKERGLNLERKQACSAQFATT